ncbi:MAG: hypothetical protein JW891_00875 [Candidatus Lokiarchaeota archaeon]|nr:hypothetical protein [Candidatus Lokiarchaeota archaeon]
MKLRVFVIILIVLIPIIAIGISLAVYGNSEWDKYHEISVDFDLDREVREAASDKIGDYMEIESFGVIITFFSVFALIAVIGVYFTNKDEEKIEKKGVNTLTKTELPQTSTRSSRENIILEANQITCPYCGTIIQLKEKKETLEGKTIRCNECDSDIDL